MARSIYVASAEGHTAKSVVALGLVEALVKRHKRVNIFRAVTAMPVEKDPILALLHQAAGSKLPLKASAGVDYRDIHDSPDEALRTVLNRYKQIEAQSDAVVVLGSDYTDVFNAAEFRFNAQIAATIATPMVVVFNGREIFSTSENMGQASARSSADLASMAELTQQEIELAHATLLAAVVNRAEPKSKTQIKNAVGAALRNVPVSVLPEVASLLAPRMSQIKDAVGGKLIYGTEESLQNEAMDLVVAAMTPEHVLERVSENSVVVVPGDRTDVLLSLLMADASSTFPKLAGIVMNGGFKIPAQIHKLIKGLDTEVPVVETKGNSFDTTLLVRATRGQLSIDDFQKVEVARKLARENIDFAKLLTALDKCEVDVVTPLQFEYQLMERASAAKKTIVLTESEDDRILTAAAEVLERGIASIILLGDSKKVLARAKQLKLNLSAAQIINIATSKHYAACVNEYVKLRAHKGITKAQAKEIMLDGAYFGTMLVQLGLADGMVSGAVNTTAHTVRPAFEFVKTKRGVSVVSGVFLMALADRVVVYGDCAVIPEPTSEQLADIAISSAATAANFGIAPRVAMLSYSTGTSGSGAEVDKVREATKLALKRAPKLSVDGPIQYDAAVDAAVAKAKLPGSAVAGRATVFVFPDLNTGNNTYKAVQRTSGALAIGPILQGLNKPVNDLSRGALVADIVNTIAITAIQAAQK